MTLRVSHWLPLCSLLLGACSASTEGWVIEAYGVVANENDAMVEGADVTLFHAETEVYLGAVRSDADGVWRMPIVVEEEKLVPLLIVAEATGYSTGRSWADLAPDFSQEAVDLMVGPTQRLDMGQQRLPAVWLVSEGAGSGAGFLRYADYADGMQGEVMSIRKGWNAPVDAEVISWEEVQISVDPDCSSQCWWELVGESGLYTATLEATVDHGLTRFPVWVTPEGRSDQEGLLAHTVEEEEMMVALRWETSEEALYLHLTGPLAGYGDFHIYYDHPKHPELTNQVTVAEMITLGSDGGTMESAMVYELRSGEYRATAHLEDGLEVWDISKTGAEIYMWWHDGMTMSRVSPGVEGTVWYALDLEIDGDAQELRHLQEYAESASADDNSDF